MRVGRELMIDTDWRK